MEVRDLHPLIENWLIQNNYLFKHEVKMPEYGRADFVAQKENGEILVIECKSKLGRSTRSHIMQLLGYCHQLGKDTLGVLASPTENISDFARCLCAEYQIHILDLENSQPDLDTKIPNTKLELIVPVDNANPLPLIISDYFEFPLAFCELDGKIYYNIQDWLNALTNTSITRNIWFDIKRRKDNLINLIELIKLPYQSTDGKTYQMDYTDDFGLYILAQSLRTINGRTTLIAIQRYLAESGVFTDALRRSAYGSESELSEIRRVFSQKPRRIRGTDHKPLHD